MRKLSKNRSQYEIYKVINIQLSQKVYYITLSCLANYCTLQKKYIGIYYSIWSFSKILFETGHGYTFITFNIPIPVGDSCMYSIDHLVLYI